MATVAPLPTDDCPNNQNHTNTNTGEIDEQVVEEDEDEYVARLVEQLTLDEKFRLLSGQSLWALAEVPRLDLPALTVSDGPHGVRKPVKELSLQESFPATCFPTACALACSWDRDLLERVGQALRDECLHYNVCVLLGPGLNLKRHAGGGRNFEYFSEDPCLSSHLAASYVRGVQTPRDSYQVGACLKHYVVNNQESHRFVVDAIVDPRTCHELYYRNFLDAVRWSNPATLMCAYNRLNGQYCSEHSEIYELLRPHFPHGVVMTDWGATNDRPTSVAVGLDLEMPGSHGAHDRALHKALTDGTLSLESIDACCDRLVRLVKRHQAVLECDLEVDFDEQDALAYRAALQCIVLLKNDDHFLPLSLPDVPSIAVVGDFAQHPRYQGMGSSQVKAAKLSCLMDELHRLITVSKSDTILTFAKGYDPDDDNPTHIQSDLLDEAVEIARGSHVVLLCVGLPEILESEGFDRLSLQLPAQHTALIREITQVHNRVVLVLSNGGMVEVCDEALHAGAILEGYLLGQAGAAATADVLLGIKSPSGKLAETMPIRKEDAMVDAHFPGTRDVVEHREGLDVGYRYFDTANLDVRFPFGHGLSYTTFEYRNLQVEVRRHDEHNTLVQVTFEVANTGPMLGREVAQCYVHDPVCSVYRPVHELRDFAKVRLQPGESATLTFELGRDAFAFYDIGAADWVVEAGKFEIQIGSSSRDIRLRQTVELTVGNPVSNAAKESYPPVKGGGTLTEVDDVTFSRRFGFDHEKILIQMRERETTNIHARFHRNSLLKEIAGNRYLGQLLLHIVYAEASKEIQPGRSQKRQQKMVRQNVENLPLRTLVLFSKGGISFEGLDTLIAVLNHEFCLATKTALKALSAASSSTISGLMRR